MISPIVRFSRSTLLLASILLSVVSLTPASVSAQSCLCDGRMTMVTLVAGSTVTPGSSVSLYADKYKSSLITTFTDVQPGDYLTITSDMVGLDRFGPKVIVDFMDGSTDAQIHTSCSEDIVGNFYGGYEAVAYTDYSGNECYIPSSIGNRVFEDQNGNGVQDDTEPGVDGITVVLYDESGNTVANTNTSNNGLYKFNNLPPGLYRLGFSNLPSSYVNTLDNVGEDDDKDSDVPHDSTKTDLINLNPAQEDDSWDLGILPEGSFPVELADFQVKNIDKIAVLKWSTNFELNNDYFEVERATDGQLFQRIGTVEGAGTTDQARNYTFEDQAAGLMGEKKIYYRLKQVDFDGAYSYSHIVEFSLEDVNTLSINAFPNPATDILNVQVDAVEKAELNLTDMTGKVLRRRMIEANNTQLISFELGQFPAGMYILHLSDGQNMVSRKVILK